MAEYCQPMPTDYAPTYCPGQGGQIAPGWYAIRTVADYMRPRFGPFDTKAEAQAVARQANADPLDPCPECGGRMLEAGTDEASGERYRQCSGECDRMERADRWPTAQDFANFGRED